MNRIEPTMSSNTTLQKIAYATGDFEQMYQVPTKHSVEANKPKQVSQEPTMHSVLEKVIEQMPKVTTEPIIKASTLIKLSKSIDFRSKNPKLIEHVVNRIHRLHANECDAQSLNSRLLNKALIELWSFTFDLSIFHSVMARAKANDSKESNQLVEEQDLELDENNYYLNQLSPLAYKAA